MDIIDEFITDNATPARRDLLMSTSELLVSLGYTNHEIEMQNVIGVQGSMDNSTILAITEQSLLEACNKLMLNYYIIVREEDELLPYIHLMEFLNYLENTVESETLTYYLNDDLSAYEQFISWVDVFRPDLVVELSDFILDVLPTLIENITQLHELKVHHEAVDYDVKYAYKIEVLKSLRKLSPDYSKALAFDMVRTNQLSTLMGIEELHRRFKQVIYAHDALVPADTALHILSLVIMTPNELSSLITDAKQLLNLLYADLNKTHVLTQHLDAFQSITGELCKTPSIT